ncbi:MAG: fibronectin type III domain-containing protein [Bacteroidota bacterium]
MKRITHYILTTTLILTMVLSGCGGGKSKGGNGGDPPNQPPGGSLTAPQNVNVTAADNQLTVEWDTVAGATSYLVWCGNTNDTGTAGKSSYETAATSYTITGLSNDNIYYIFVQAKNSAGVSSPSSLRNGTPFHSTNVPAAPGTPDLIPGNGQLTVKWDAVTGATYYDVYYSTGSSPPANPAQENITIASCTITGLINGTTYYVWVKAKNNIGSSDFSPGASGTPIAAPTLTAGDRQITVNWNAVTGATSYQVWYGTSSDISAANQYGSDITSGTSCTITGLNAGTTYYVWVKANKSSGESVFSPSANIEPYISIGEIAGGTGSYKDGDLISFGKNFSVVPKIVVNAYDATGKPLIAGVRSESNFAATTTGFYIKIHDVYGEDGGTPVTDSATVQWVAIVPNFSGQVQVQSGYGLYVNGEVVNFANAFTLPSPNPFHYPHVICSAYEECDLYGNPTQKPIMAAPYNIASNKFTVSLQDADGISSTAYLSYIALVPPPNYNYYHEVAMVSGYNMYNNYNGKDRSVQFILTQNADAVICSAQKNNEAFAVAAWDNSRYGFNLGILNYLGEKKSDVWTSWLVLGFK